MLGIILLDKPIFDNQDDRQEIDQHSGYVIVLKKVAEHGFELLLASGHRIIAYDLTNNEIAQLTK